MHHLVDFLPKVLASYNQFFYITFLASYSSRVDTVAGKHVINLFIQYTPFHLKNGDWQDQVTRVSMRFCSSHPSLFQTKYADFILCFLVVHGYKIISISTFPGFIGTLGLIVNSCPHAWQQTDPLCFPHVGPFCKEVF